jgi:hypothetical protein
MTPTLTISGTLTMDPTIRYSREGIATTVLIVDTDLNSGSAEFEVRAQGDLAENAALTFQRGHGIIVTGTMDVEPDDSRFIWATDLGPSLLAANATVHGPLRAIRTDDEQEVDAVR